MNTICGHERNVLLWLLTRQGDVKNSTPVERERAWVDLNDPTKLAQMLVHELRRANLSSGLRIRDHVDGERLSYTWEILELPNPSCPMAKPGIGICPNGWEVDAPNTDLSVPQALQLLKGLLSLADGESSAAEQLIRNAHLVDVPKPTWEPPIFIELKNPPIEPRLPQVPYIWLRSQGREDLEVMRVPNLDTFDALFPDATTIERDYAAHVLCSTNPPALDVIGKKITR